MHPHTPQAALRFTGGGHIHGASLQNTKIPRAGREDRRARCCAAARTRLIPPSPPPSPSHECSACCSPKFLKDVSGNALAPIYFGGVYLPLLWGPSELLSRTPLFLAYNDSHFTALIPEVTKAVQFAPLADRDGAGFPIKFADQRSPLHPCA